VAQGPALTCKQPPALGAGPYFTNVTVEVGLAADTLDVTGNRLAFADINEDGFPDLFVHTVGGGRDDLTATPPDRRKRVLLNQEGTNGERVFADFTDQSGYLASREPGFTGRASNFAIFADVNNDGHVDIFSATYAEDDPNIPDHGDRSEVLLGNGDGTFALAPSSGPTAPPTATSAAFLDYDRDGRLDLFVGFWYRDYPYVPAQQDRLYQGDGAGSFADVTGEMGLTTTTGGHEQGTNHRPTYGVTVCDVDGDADPDILVSAYGRQLNMLWENQSGTGFVNVAEEKGFDADDNLDYSDNQYFKCYCDANPTAPECDPDPGSPRITCGDYWNPGSDDRPWRLGGNTFTTVCGDIDNDGDMDLFNAEIRHWHVGLSSDPSELLINDGNGENWVFDRPGNYSNGLQREWPRSDWNDGDITAGFLDFDNDGMLDIFLGCSDYPDTHDFLFRQVATRQFEDVTEASGAGHYYGNGIALADYDRDGDIDIAVGSSTMRCSSDPNCTWTTNEVHLYRNEVGQDSNWLAIRLVGAGEGASNVSAIGARVMVYSGTTRQLREVQGGYGHFGLQSPFTQYFGLGEACVADEVVIIWPTVNFTVSQFRYVPANYFVTVYEADGTITFDAP
jgi:hypothetical protein